MHDVGPYGLFYGSIFPTTIKLTVNDNYHLFPIPVSEVLATGGIITQNDGY